MARCTLHLGTHLVLVANGGAPEVEYALFDPGEIELQQTEPSTIREVGYRTTAADARARLASLDFTAAVAGEAAAAAKPAAAHAYARGPSVRSVVGALDAAELFEGGAFEASGEGYVGTWLDLAALAADLEVKGAQAIAQGLHLAALLAEAGDDEPVVLATAEIAATLRPGERTHKRGSFDSPRALVRALRTLAPATRARADPGPTLRDVLARLRERAQRSAAARDRVAAVQELLTRREMPARGPLADAELWAIEAAMSRGEARGAVEQLDEIERRRGRLPATTYLRERAALLTRAEDPYSVAERASALSTSMAAFHELQLLASQAWASAGDLRRAQAFARDLVENTSVCDAIRVHALAILEAEADDNRAPRLKAQSLPSSSAPPSSTMPVDSSSQRPVVPPDRESERARPAIGSLPPFRAEKLDPELSSDAVSRITPRAEHVELLSMPPGASSEPPQDETLPQTPAAARLAFTHSARELAREVRMRHGIELRIDAEGLEHAQRYLREALVHGRARTAEERRELMRYGAFLSELLARRLGAQWVDVDSQDPGRWAMLIPCASRVDEGLRVWPFARVMRFVAMGHKERDLVSYYLELEARSR